MSVEALAIVLHHSKAKATAKLVLIGIANHDGDGGSYPTIGTLARYANVDESSVRKALRMLRSMGEVRVHVQAGGDRDCPDELRPNLYELLVACPPWCDRTRQHRDTRKLAGKQPPLWINRGANSPGGAIAPPGPGGDSAPQTVHNQHSTPGGASTTGQAREEQPPRWTPPRLDRRPCDECSQPQAECERRQTKLAADAQHPYRPRRAAAR